MITERLVEHVAIARGHLSIAQSLAFAKVYVGKRSRLNYAAEMLWKELKDIEDKIDSIIRDKIPNVELEHDNILSMDAQEELEAQSG